MLRRLIIAIVDAAPVVAALRANDPCVPRGIHPEQYVC